MGEFRGLDTRKQAYNAVKDSCMAQYGWYQVYLRQTLILKLVNRPPAHLTVKAQVYITGIGGVAHAQQARISQSWYEKAVIEGKDVGNDCANVNLKLDRSSSTSQTKI